MKLINVFKLVKIKTHQKLRQFLGQKVVYVIGDSHTLSFQSERLIVSYIGAVTAFNLVKENSTSKGREKLFAVVNKLKKGDKVLLVFGEIDARMHVFNQHMKSKKKDSMEKIMEKVVKNYEKVINEIMGRGIEVMVYNIVPPGNQGNIYNYPFYADWKTRLWITSVMNDMLKDMCKRNGLKFIDIYRETINSNNLTEEKYRLKEFIFDEVHLNDKITNLVQRKMEIN